MHWLCRKRPEGWFHKARPRMGMERGVTFQNPLPVALGGKGQEEGGPIVVDAKMHKHQPMETSGASLAFCTTGFRVL